MEGLTTKAQKEEDGRWRMEDGRWKMEDGGWRMEDGSRSVTV